MAGSRAEEAGLTPEVLKSPSSFEEALRIERDETSAQGGGREVWSPAGQGLGPGWIHSFIVTEHLLLCAGQVRRTRAPETYIAQP